MGQQARKDGNKFEKAINAHGGTSQACLGAGRMNAIPATHFCVTDVPSMAGAPVSVLKWVQLSQCSQSPRRAVLLSAGPVLRSGLSWSCINVCQHHTSGAGGTEGRQRWKWALVQAAQAEMLLCPTLLSVLTSCSQELEFKSLHGQISPAACKGSPWQRARTILLLRYSGVLFVASSS